MVCDNSVNDPNKNLDLKKFSASYTYDTSIIKVTLPPHNNILHFNSKIAEIKVPA